jgi:hypothetical protein
MTVTPHHHKRSSPTGGTFDPNTLIGKDRGGRRKKQRRETKRKRRKVNQADMEDVDMVRISL